MLPERVLTDDRNLERETSSGALLNTNKTGLLQARLARERAADYDSSKREIQDLRTLVASMCEHIQLMTEVIQFNNPHIKL